MPVIIGGEPKEPPSGLRCISWHEYPELRLRRGQDCTARKGRVQAIVLHTTKGIPGGTDKRPQRLLPGFGPSTDAGARCARYWSGDGRNAGAHCVVDCDGTIAWCADPVLDSAYHAGPVNDITVGVEIYQGADGEIYEGAVDTVVLFCDWFTSEMGIQRQIPDKYRGPVRRLVDRRGADFVGIYGHRDCSANRGAGDPGSYVFRRLAAAGYEDFDLGAEEDLVTWRVRQGQLGVVPDGIPGPKTVAALARRGYAHGLWVSRPGDAAPWAEKG